jgi:putative transposase
LPKKLFKLSEICYKKRIKKKYPSDITKEQFEQLRSILEIGRKKTAPRKADLYEVFCAILYLLKSGCQRRMPPEVISKWNTVY